MGPASIALAGASSIVGAMGQQYSAEAQANMYTYQAGISTLNQQIASRNADYARHTGEIQAQESGMKTAELVGEQKVGQAAGNLDVNRGSAVGVRQSQEAIGAEDQALIRSNAARTAYGYEIEAAKEGAQAGVYGMAATTSRQAGDINMFTTLLGGMSSVASKWTQASQSGMFGGGSGGSGGMGTDPTYSSYGFGST